MALEAIDEVLKSAAPILFATLGAVIGQRAGVLNLGLEGVVYLSAAVAALVGFPWGFLVAILVGTLFNLLYYILSNDLALNQIILGFAFTMAAYGLGSQIAQGVVGRPLGKPVIYGWEAFAAGVLLAFAAWYLFKTRLGAAIKASGDDPPSLDLIGVDVYRIRRIAGVLEGALASAAGAYITLYYYGSWSESLPMGWGTLAVITAMIALWSPLLAVPASLVPSVFTSLAYTLQGALVISAHILNAIPFVASIAMLTTVQLLVKIARIKTRVPRWLARPYIREERA